MEFIKFMSRHCSPKYPDILSSYIILLGVVYSAITTLMHKANVHRRSRTLIRHSKTIISHFFVLNIALLNHCICTSCLSSLHTSIFLFIIILHGHTNVSCFPSRPIWSHCLKQNIETLKTVPRQTIFMFY